MLAKSLLQNVDWRITFGNGAQTITEPLGNIFHPSK